jgi:GMP synthase (glutamine-hydrolysing)
MKRVVVVQHAECEKPGLIAEALRSRGYALESVLTWLGAPVPKDLNRAEGLVIMGGPTGAYEYDRYPFLRDEMSLMASALRESKPLLGVCLGSQLLAAALGAEVRKGRQKEIGWHPITLTEAALGDPLLKGLDQTFAAYHWHGDVFDVPRGAVTLASSSLTACQAFRYGKCAYGFLFHMEVVPEILEGMLRTFTDELKEEGLNAEEIRRQAATHLPTLEAIGKRVFQRWAAWLNGCEKK